MKYDPIDYLLIGHIAADVVPGGFTLGGTVAYAAATAHAFGLRTGIVTSAHPDEPLLNDLRQYAEVTVIPAAHTTTFDNQYTDAGRVQYCHHVAAPLTIDHVPDVWYGTRMVHIAPLMNEIDNALVGRLSTRSRSLITPQGWLRQRDTDNRVVFKAWADTATFAHADLIVLSDEDIAPELEARYAKLAQHLIVTRGKNGGTLYMQQKSSTYEAVVTAATDLTGAGDVFATAAFIAWQHHRRDLPAAVRIAAQLAAHAVTRNGLNSAPTSNEIDAALAAHP